MKHRTKDGRVMDLSEMTDTHLINTIKYIKRRAKEGVVIQYGAGSDGDFYYDEEELFGTRAEEFLELPAYVKEAKRRGMEL